MWRLTRLVLGRFRSSFPNHLGYLRPENEHDFSRHHGSGYRCLLVGRLRSKHEIDVLAEELSGLAGSKDAALALIEYATAEPYSFLFVRLDAKNRFERKLCIQESNDGLDDGERKDEQVREDGQTSRKSPQRPQRAPSERK